MRNPLPAKVHPSAIRPSVLNTGRVEEARDQKWPVWMRIVFIVSVSVALWTLIIKSAVLILT